MEQPAQPNMTNEPTGPPQPPMRPFLVLWSGQALSILGSQAVQFAIIWWLTAETGSATVLATASLIGLLPPVVLGPFAGALVDRWNRKRVMLVADSAVAAASAALALLFALDSASPGFVFGALLVRAIGATFHGPAMIASTTLMVPERHLTRIQGLNQSLQGGLLIVSAPLGGLLLALLSMAQILVFVDVGTALIAVAVLAFVRVPQPQAAERTAGERPSVLREVGAGLRYLRDRPGHRAIIVIGTVINLFLIPAFSLLPLLVFEELRGSALQLAGLNSSLGVGMLAGGLLLGIWGGFRRRIVTTLVALVFFGGATLALGLAPTTVWAAAAMFGVGALVPLVNGPIQAVLQATVAPELQGRIFTLVGSLAGLAAPIGLVLAAPVAEWFGVRLWYVAGAVACVLMGAGGFLSRAMMQIEETAPDAVDAATAAADA